MAEGQVAGFPPSEPAGGQVASDGGDGAPGKRSTHVLRKPRRRTPTGRFGAGWAGGCRSSADRPSPARRIRPGTP